MSSNTANRARPGSARRAGPGARSAQEPDAPAPARPPLLLLLFAGAALIAGFTLLRYADPFDEGLVLQTARRVADGQVPYRDFLWAYGPAQPYVLGASFKAFGVSLLGWRLLRLAAVAGAAVLVYVLTRRLAGRRFALVAWLTAATALAQPASANPFAVTLLLVLAAIALATRAAAGRADALGAGLLIGLAAAWRLDFALFAGAGIGLALLLRARRGAGPAPAAAFALAAAGLGLLLHLPFLIASGPAGLYDALLGTSLREGDFWRLPFPLAYDGPLRAWPPGPLAEDLKDVLGLFLPLLLVAGLGAAVLLALLRARTERRVPEAWIALLGLAVGGLAYLLSRTDEFHLAPLAVVLAVLLPAGIAWTRSRGWRLVPALLAVMLGLMLLHGAANRLSALLRPPELVPVPVAVADGVKAPPAEAAALGRMVRLVQSRVPPGAPIYVAPRRADLVRFNNPLVYVLTERDNPTRRDFGLQTGAPAQRQIVATLRRTRPPAVVRWTDPISSQREPNLRGRPSGVRLLDEYLARDYRLLERAGYYAVLVPRQP